MKRTVTEVVYDHLMKRLSGDLEGDIKENFDENVVILTGFATYRGHDGVRQSDRLLREAVPEGQYSYNRAVIEREYGFLEWRGRGKNAEIRDGADSFHVRDGKIVMQSIHYTTWPE